MDDWYFLADVGGTNVRFARALGDGQQRDFVSQPVSARPRFVDALNDYLASLGGVGRCRGAMLAGAGPRDGQRIALTNNDWVLDTEEIGSALSTANVGLMNDLEAVALALPELNPGDVEWFKAPMSSSGLGLHRAPMLAVNVGTGFGAACAVPTAGDWVACPSEAGHTSLGASNSEELAVFNAVAGNRPATIEDLLSGHGVSSLYAALNRDRTQPPMSAEEVMKSTSDPVAEQVRHLFGVVFGRVVGDLVLTSGAWGGVFLCGSVATHWSAGRDAPSFLAAMAGTSPMQRRLSQVPCGVIAHSTPALLGLEIAARRLG